MFDTNATQDVVIPPLYAEGIEASIATKPSTLKEEFLAKSMREIRLLNKQLFVDQSHLRSWETHYDFQLWHQTESYFEKTWPELKKSIYMAIEYDLYDKVKSLFLDIRHLLQTTGRIKERIYLANWLRNQAKRRQDTIGFYISISSLIWSYTSAGGCQNLPKATSLWQAFGSILDDLGSPYTQNTSRRTLLKEGSNLYTELLMDIYEGGVRLAVRRQKFEEAETYITKGKAEISALSGEGFLTDRLKERFDIAFSYHEGVALYLKGDYPGAQESFSAIVERTELIAWTRAARGAKSWLATLAMEDKDYETCEKILVEITATHPHMLKKRDGICHLIRAQLLHECGKRKEKEQSEKLACFAFRNFRDDNNNHKAIRKKRRDMNYRELYRIFGLAHA